jgi:hypothetical protein
MAFVGVRLWPDSAVSSIRRARQLSGDKLPSLGWRATAEDDPQQTFGLRHTLTLLPDVSNSEHGRRDLSIAHIA